MGTNGTDVRTVSKIHDVVADWTWGWGTGKQGRFPGLWPVSLQG